MSITHSKASGSSAATPLSSFSQGTKIPLQIINKSASVIFELIILAVIDTKSISRGARLSTIHVFNYCYAHKVFRCTKS